MKKSKLISIICILAMSFSWMFSIVHATENGKVSIELDTASTDTNKIINVYFENFEYISGTKVSVNLKNIRDFIAYPDDADVGTNAKKAAYVKDNYITPSGVLEAGFQSESLLWATFKYNIVASAPNSAEPLSPSSEKELVLKIELPLTSALTDDVVISLISDGTTSNTYVNYVVEADTDTGYATGGTIANSEDITLTIAKPEEEEEPTTPVVDTAVAGNDMYGQKTFLTKFETSNNVADPNVVIAKGDESKTYGSENFPSGVVGGTMKLIAIVRYAAEAAVAGDVFTVTLNDGTTALGSTTYTVPAAE